ncbi:MAG TPA: pentapeptide repeat-containing protein [Gammaproteobacteria bacterium]|jgi:uncharacterized protein YjbI with pentapeptide repeats|nr:pentapeptide repeat-containing protein [Gammaproteobacteria bacterium]
MNSDFLSDSEYNDQELTNLVYTDTSLEGVRFYDCRFVACNFSGSDIRECVFTDCTFINCNLSVVKFDRSRFSETDFESCKLIGVDWTRARWPDVKISSPVHFYQSVLSDSSFFGLYLREIRINECKLHGVDFSEADCAEGYFGESDLLNSKFHHTNLKRADFTNASNYNIDVYTNELKGARFSLPEAVSLLNGLDISLIK